MKLCINCEHYKKIVEYSYCMRNAKDQIDLVDGHKFTRGHVPAAQERYAGDCKEEGKFYKDKWK